MRAAIGGMFGVFFCLFGSLQLASSEAAPSGGKGKGCFLLAGPSPSCKTPALALGHREYGLLLKQGVFTVRLKDRLLRSDSEGAARTTDNERVTIQWGREARLTCTIAKEEVLAVSLAGEGVSELAFSAEAVSSTRAFPALLLSEREEDKSVLKSALGPVSIASARSLFDPLRDCAMSVSPTDEVLWKFDGETWRVAVAVKRPPWSFAIKVTPRYYRDVLGIRYYAARKVRHGWERPPVVAMTWYGIEGWKGNPAQRKEWLYPQIDWVACNLLPYAERLVFQLDDNYLKDNDQYMRDISDYIRSKGMIPGIWFTPFTVAPLSVSAAHPQWFLHNKEGKLIKTFGGVSYRGHHTLNVSNAEALEKCFGAWWHKVSERWNFDFFKIDGQPQVIRAYRASVDGGGVEAYRKGLRYARSIVGEEKFINGCWGIPLEAIRCVDGSRTGPDTGNHPHAIGVVLRWNFLNNVCWWCDPDAAANLFRATVERARLNAQARVLTGQQFLTDDVWTKVPEPIMKVWQRSFPVLAVHPVNLYPIEAWRRYDLFDLRISKAGRTWDVAGLFNYDGKDAVTSFDLSRLGLSAEKVHVYEFWKGSYVGLFQKGDSFDRLLKGYEGEVFAVVPASAERPVLLSTSRHVTQGAVDIERCNWRQDGKAWIAEGLSSHLVGGDPYELVFAQGAFEVKEAVGAGLTCRVSEEACLSRVRFTPRRKGGVAWEVRFEPRRTHSVSVTPAQWVLRPGKLTTAYLRQYGPGSCRWKAQVSDPRLSVEPKGGTLSEEHSVALSVCLNGKGLPRGSVWKGLVTVEVSSQQGTQHLRVPVCAVSPPPENLALEARASASSRWGRNYAASKVNDGQSRTRWNSKAGDRDGAWIELLWKKTVTFDTVVIHECIDFGPRIRTWRLEAGEDSLRQIARGSKVGGRFMCKLPKAVTAQRLRFTVEKATEVPTLWEIEVYRYKEKD